MRIGLHINNSPGHRQAVEYCRRVKPPFMKWLSPDAAILRECLAVSPGTRHIGRIVWGEQTHDRRNAFDNRVLDAAREFKGLIHFWEGYNEHIGDSAPEREIRQFAADEVNFAKKLNAIGVGALIGGFSTGTLDDGKLRSFTEALDYANLVGPDKCMLHSHEYAAAYVGYCVKTPDGKNQWPDGGGFTGISTDPNVWRDRTLKGWLTLRYRDLIPLVKTRWPRVRLVITEWGIDNTTKDPRSNSKGWKDSRGTQFETILGLGNYAGQGGWYAWQASADADFIGGIVDFGFGATDPAWGSFNLGNEPAMLEQFTTEQERQPATGGATPPPQPPPPAPPPPGGTPPMNDADRALLALAATKQAIQLNPAAGLQKSIAADGFWPTSGEFDSAAGVAQRAEHPTSGEVRVYEWNRRTGALRFVTRPRGGGGDAEDTPNPGGLLWPVGEPEAERHGVGTPAGWGIAIGFDADYWLGVHTGLDLSKPGETDLGAGVYAVADGAVVSAKAEAGTWGNVILIEHRGVGGKDRLWSQYAHLGRIDVQPGQPVKQGQRIGTVGNGSVAGVHGATVSAHLHFELRKAPLPAGHWPSGKDRLQTPLVHEEIRRYYLDPAGLLGAE